MEEADYISLVDLVLSGPNEIYVRTINYTGDLSKLNSRLKILAAYWSDWIDIYVLRPPKVVESVTVKPEFYAILQKYWGFSVFRDFQVYDLAKLDNGEKEVVTVSQAKIISDIVQQVELCEGGGTDFRDVFVTAPTGVGKSVMFQIPAIYLAEKYNLLTIVISPLIGLMNDQVKNLEVKNYAFAKTINSDISPIVKQEIRQRVANSEYHILYISPETLLSRSDIEQLIGESLFDYFPLQLSKDTFFRGRLILILYYFRQFSFLVFANKHIERCSVSKASPKLNTMTNFCLRPFQFLCNHLDSFFVTNTTSVVFYFEPRYLTDRLNNMNWKPYRITRVSNMPGY